MKIKVSVKTRLKKEQVEKLDENYYLVCVNAPPIKGLANQAVVNILAEYFNVSKSQISIVAGKNFKEKVVEIN